MAPYVFSLQKFLLPLPAVEVFLHVFAVLNVKIAGEFRETFRQPLVVIAFPADAVAPPLVRTFVTTEEIRQLNTVREADHMALGAIKKRGGPQVNQTWPALAVRIGNGQAGDREMLIRVWPKVGGKYADSVGHFLAHLFGHGRGRETANRANVRAGLNGPLHLVHQVVALSIRIDIDDHLARLIADHLVVPVTEAGDRKRNFTLP